VVPETVIDGLLANIFRIKHMLDAVILVVGIATALALVLVFALSLRLRQREIHTVFRIGGSRLTIARLLVAEIAIIVLYSGVLCAAVIVLVQQYSDELVRTLFIS
jgi:putative ABC transport system permease protein